jgi:WhiB family redox-sensing transcriptional regulator
MGRLEDLLVELDLGWAPEGWRDQARCKSVGPDFMHPVYAADVPAAKAVCTGCPVRDECLASALEHNEDLGIRGGLSESERRQLRRRRRLPSTPAPHARFAAIQDADDRRLFDDPVEATALAYGVTKRTIWRRRLEATLRIPAGQVPAL